MPGTATATIVLSRTIINAIVQSTASVAARRFTEGLMARP